METPGIDAIVNLRGLTFVIAWKASSGLAQVAHAIAARSGDALLRRVTDRLRRMEAEHTATGMAAAWLLTRFAGFRTLATSVAEGPSSDLLDSVGFREEAPGANVWLVVPSDRGVFRGVGERDGVRCVPPVQAYLDLKGQPERADEAATHLRTEVLTWSADA